MPDEPTRGAPPATEIVLYQTEDGRTRVQVRERSSPRQLFGSSEWFGRKNFAELYAVFSSPALLGGRITTP